MADDEQLLGDLTRALAPARVEPSSQELRAVRLAFDAAAAKPRRGLSVGRIAFTAVAASLVVVLGAAALAVGGVAPRSVQQVAQSLRLPVTDPDVRDAENALGALEAALDGNDTETISGAVAATLEALEALDEEQRRDIAPRADALLAAAARRLEPTDTGTATEDGATAEDTAPVRATPSATTAPPPSPNRGPGSSSNSGPGGESDRDPDDSSGHDGDDDPTTTTLGDAADDH